MYWKQTRREFEAGKGDGNKFAQMRQVMEGHIPGLIAYMDGVPAGWIAVEPRVEFPTLNRSRILAPLDDEPVWSVPCFFVGKDHRGQGLTVALLQAAVKYVRKQGGKIVEGYPVEPREEKEPPVFVYTGLTSAFTKAGFEEAGRRSARRPIMRFQIK